MEILLALFGKMVSNPLTTFLGVSTIGLGLFGGFEYLDNSYKASQIATLNNTIEADQLAIKNWQTRFGQLQDVTNSQNAQITALQAEDAELNKKIASSNTEIDNYEKELAADAKQIAAQVVPSDCPAALNVLVNNVKANVSKLKIERPNR